MERHELLDDAQEAFRKGRSTQRQLLKLQNFLEDQRNAKHPVVLLYWEQGAAPSTLVFNQAFNPVHTVARLCGRG